MTCKTCSGEMIQKSRWRLFIVGAIMIGSLALAVFIPYFWIPAVLLGLTGAYLIVWATLGRGCWCRACKRFGT